MIEELLQLLVREVDTQLLKTVKLNLRDTGDRVSNFWVYRERGSRGFEEKGCELKGREEERKEGRRLVPFQSGQW